MPKPHRLSLDDLQVSTFEPLTPVPIDANMKPDSNASECDCGLYTLNGANTCGWTYCNPGTCWIDCVG
jgi:hypothetical protein